MNCTKARSAAGPHDATPTTWLRHTGATNCIREEIPIRDVMTLMGHKNLETTVIYLKQLDLENVPIAQFDRVR